jgi:hypothetical protein
MVLLGACSARALPAAVPIVNRPPPRHAGLTVAVSSVEDKCVAVRADSTRNYQAEPTIDSVNLAWSETSDLPQCPWGAPVPLAKRNAA